MEGNHKCSKCDYTTSFKHNVYRHTRTKHRVEELPSDFEETPKPKGKAPRDPQEETDVEVADEDFCADDESGEGYYDDLESMVDEKLAKFLESKNIKISDKGRSTAIKSFMNSNVATLCAGMCLGYLITANMPLVMAMMRRSLNGASPVSAGVPMMTPEQMELVKMAMAKQAGLQNQSVSSVQNHESTL